MKSLAVEKFGRGELESLDGDERKVRLEELAKILESRIPEIDLEYKWHDELPFIIQELKDIGHDIWTWDTKDGKQVWGGDYMRPKTAGKLVVTFIYPKSVQVEWEDMSNDFMRWPPIDGFHAPERKLRNSVRAALHYELNRRLSEYEDDFRRVNEKSLDSYLIECVERLIDELNLENYRLCRLDYLCDGGIVYGEQAYSNGMKLGTGLTIHFMGFSARVSWIDQLPLPTEA